MMRLSGMENEIRWAQLKRVDKVSYPLVAVRKHMPDAVSLEQNAGRLGFRALELAVCAASMRKVWS
eukprot:2567754-Rhodomonas_salina.3